MTKPIDAKVIVLAGDRPGFGRLHFELPRLLDPGNHTIVIRGIEDRRFLEPPPALETKHKLPSSITAIGMRPMTWQPLRYKAVLSLVAVLRGARA